MQAFVELMRDFCGGVLTAQEFEEQYSDLWRETRDQPRALLNKREAEILDQLFTDIDAFTDDPDVLHDPMYGKYSIDGDGLRAAVKKSLEQLLHLQTKR
jgi:hypothetical protein